MELSRFFEESSSGWVRYSEYQYKNKDEFEYITPATTAQIEIYNPLEIAQELIVDALNLGNLFCREERFTDICKENLFLFAGKYGLIGFMTSLPLNGNFFEYPHVLLGRNKYFDGDVMDTKEYLAFFQPFGIKEGQPRPEMPPPALILSKPLEYGIVFSRNYAEPTDWIYGLFCELYTHFAACFTIGKTGNPQVDEACEKIIGSFMEYGLGFRITMRNKPTMQWNFNSLKMTIETVYAFLISREDSLLRACKHCGEVFYATHGRSEFCSGRCRNQFNVYKSRGKDRN